MEDDASSVGEADILLEYQNDSTLELTADLTAGNEDEAMDVTPESELATETQEGDKKEMENLKICIDNEPDPENAVTFLKLEKDGSSKADDAADDDADGPRIQVTMKSTKDRAKLYENKIAISSSGIDTTSKEARKQRLERAKRFGLDEADISTEKEVDLNLLYESLGYEAGCELDSIEGDGQVRTNVIMLKGVDALSTDEIFKYLIKYPPRNLEWIDDSSCNAVFATRNGCDRALMNMSHALKTNKLKAEKSAKNRLGKNDTSTSATNPEDSANDKAEESKDTDDDNIDLMTDIGEDNPSPETLPLQKQQTSNTSISQASTKTLQMDMEEGELSDDSEDDGDSVYVDDKLIPPGKWRVGIPCEKSKGKLFMRYATVADVKVKGAEGRSQYYRKYGNPNYGGLPGLISKSKKQRFRQIKDQRLKEEAREAVSGGREKVTYNDDDLFGETYEEPVEGSQATSLSGADRLRAEPDTGIRGILSSRKRTHDKGRTTDIKEEIDDYLENTVSSKKKKKEPMMGKMAADEEEEKISVMRAQAAAVMAELDVRSQLERRRRKQKSTYHSYDDGDDYRDYDGYSDEEYETTPIKPEPRVKPDLRSRLSRRNDW